MVFKACAVGGARSFAAGFAVLSLLAVVAPVSAGAMSVDRSAGPPQPSRAHAAWAVPHVDARFVSAARQRVVQVYTKWYPRASRAWKIFKAVEKTNDLLDFIDQVEAGYATPAACPSPFPARYFCRPEPQSSYARGVAFEAAGQVGGLFASPDRYGKGPLRSGLSPGQMYWLTCSVTGRFVSLYIGDVRVTSTIWYRLPNGWWISAAWVWSGVAPSRTVTKRC